MMSFFLTRPGFGIEITTINVRAVALSGKGAKPDVLSVKKIDLPENTVVDNYAAPNIQNPERLTEVLRECLAVFTQPRASRAALSLPDSVFRVQTLEFDQFPKNATERDRLIRWRLEKTAAFDISDTTVRYQILRRQSPRLTVLVCVAKQAVISQYEQVLFDLGLEPWTIGLTSFHTLNFYSPYIVRSPLSAFTYVTDDSFSTMVVENGEVGFYRFKEMKRGNGTDIRSRLIREIEDSLHFYRHLNPAQQAEVAHLYLAGEASMRDSVAEDITAGASLGVEVLTPGLILSGKGEIGPEMAAALGAGGSL